MTGSANMAFILAHAWTNAKHNLFGTFASLTDKPDETPQDAEPADAYKRRTRWRDAQLDWRELPFARETALATLRAYEAAVHLEPLRLPPAMLAALLRIDTALVRTWDRLDAPPPLEAYRSYAVGGEPGRRSHHPAWLPLALQMAVTSEDCVGYTLFPWHWLAYSPSVGAHFRLSNGLTAPVLPPALSPELLERARGMWELVASSPTMHTAKGRLLLAADGWFAAQFTALGGLFHFAYAGRWHVDDDSVLHNLCLCNSPMACNETLEPSTVFGQVAPDGVPRCSYGGVRQRQLSFSDDGLLRLTTPGVGTRTLIWRRIPEMVDGQIAFFSSASGGRWAGARDVEEGHGAEGFGFASPVQRSTSD